jgi:protein SCO1/2
MSTSPTDPASPDVTSQRWGNRRRIRIASVLLGVAVAGIFGTVLALASHRPPPALAPTFEPAFARTVPQAIETMPLTDEHGQTVDLADFRGRIVVLADFLTSCQNECPISTGAFLTLERDLRADGLRTNVSIVEVTVDPKRDNPGRLAAYEKYTGVDWTLLTGSQAQITRFWQHFGASYNDVPDGPNDMTAVDWETGKRYTYDVDHSNNVYVFDAAGHERLLTAGLPSIGKTLPPKLASLLSPLGVEHLDDPGFGSWTVADLRSAIGSLLGRSVPAG